ncbi:MAG: hypothetical protein KIT22_06935 [Verrucomicrobiae bacterium]|nr:hypothetical protein [Verrucomicrobiae bacterium]
MKTPVLSTLGRLLLLALAGVFLGGCCSSPIFRANFDADTVGALPNSNPPGNPVGDTIWSTASGDPALLSVVNDPVFSSRSVRFANTGPLIRYVGFIPIDASSSAEKIFAYWAGVMGSASAPLDIWLGDTHFATIGGIRFESGNVRVRTAAGYDTIGSYTPGVSHVVVLTFNRSAGTFGVSFLQGGNSSSSTDLPLITPSAAGTIRPTLYMAYLGGGSASAQYVADDIVISERQPNL